MKFNFQMLHHYLRKNLTTILIVVVLLFFGFSQYKASRMYKAYISNRLDNDIRNLMIAIRENNRVYETILESGRISREQMNTLMGCNQQIRDIVNECRNLAVELNMRKEEFRYNETSVNAYKITHVFYGLLLDEEIRKYEIELDSKLKFIITKMYELNSKWNSITNNFISLTFNLSNPSWLKLIEDIENSTLTFLEENDVENITDIWLKRTEIR